jgi:ATP-binding cassette, subfamily B, bacterial
VVGENGSGKTTLVKLLLGLYRPTSGSITVDDVELAAIAGNAWRSRCTAAFQDFSRFSLPAVESVGVAELPSLESEPLALAALDRAGAAELPRQLPSGLATYVGGPYTGGHNLSCGQWQKLALGRAMRSPEPLLVVLDEPTAALDPHAEQALFERYVAASAAYAGTAGPITLLVSHRFATVRMADLIIYLESGGVVEAGIHDELMETGGRYADLSTPQAQGYRLVHPPGLDSYQIDRYSDRSEAQSVIGAMQRCKRKPGVSACWPESRPRSQRPRSRGRCRLRRLRRRSPLRPR